MIVAVLGANGQLGSDIIRVACEMASSLETLALTRRELDVCELAAIPEALSKRKFDVLVNCTGYHKTDEVEGHATEAFRINAHAVAAMARVCKARGVRFVQVSTDYVFDGGADRPYSETNPPNPINVYGASKLLGETLALREYSEGTLIARVASLFGIAGSSGKGGNFVETILRKVRETGEVRVVDDIIMSPTLTADAARVLLTLLRNVAPSGVYHVVNSGSASWYEFARQMVQEAGMAARVAATPSSAYPTVAARPPYSVLDNRKAAAQAGEIPHWRDALHRYLLEKGYLPSIAAKAAGD